MRFDEEYLRKALAGPNAMFIGKAKVAITYCPNCLRQLAVMEDRDELIYAAHFDWKEQPETTVKQ